MPTRFLAATIVVVLAASTLLMSGCERVAPLPPSSSTSPSLGSTASSTPTPTPTPTPSPTDTPEPVTRPESKYTDTALASMLAAVSMDGQQPQVMDAQQVRWRIASLSVTPGECAVLVTGLASAASRGLPVAMATMGSETDPYTIVVVGADDPTREQVVTDRKLASKRCSKLTTVYGDPAGSSSVSTDWVVRQGTPASDLEDVIEVDLTTASGVQQRIIAGRLGNVLIQVTSNSAQPGEGEKLNAVVAAVADRVRASQGSASPSPSPSPTPPSEVTPSP